MNNYVFDCNKCMRRIHRLTPDIYKEAYEGHDHCLSCRESVSIEREAWDAVEKERGKYIDKKKLLEYLNHRFESEWTYEMGLGETIQEEIIWKIESGTFDIQEDETNG